MRRVGLRLCLVLLALGFSGHPAAQPASTARAQRRQQHFAAQPDITRFAPGYAGVVFTQLPLFDNHPAHPGGLVRADYGDGARLMLLKKDGSLRTLTPEFHSTADPVVSFDGKKVLFAGKKSAQDSWNVFEMNADGSGIRQITRDMGNCRTPMYQSALFYLNDPKPSYQVTFVSDAGGELNESVPAVAQNLYSIRMDGSGLRRLTYGVSSSYDPVQMADGRIVFSNWQRHDFERGPHGRIDLFGVSIDGTDFAVFSGSQGKRIKHMATATANRSIIFVESDEPRWDGSGSLASLALRRNLHSYRAITALEDGLFHSPSPLPDGSILVSMRPTSAGSSHSIYRLNPESGKRDLVFSDARYHNIQAVALVGRTEADGHSSVVEDDQQWSKLYCLSMHKSDLGDHWPKQTPGWRVRIVEGLPHPRGTEGQYLKDSPRSASAVPGATTDSLSGLVQKRVLGETRIHEDGSFHLTIPPNIPVQVQLVDAGGMAVRTSAWIWTKNKENRGCIGCHEDNELTPENVYPVALDHPAADLTLPPARRRTVDFRRDVLPILEARCASCHDNASRPPQLKSASGDASAVFSGAYATLLAAEDGPAGLSHRKYVDPGRARTSRLAWSLMGKSTARPWDRVPASPVKAMPPDGATQLTLHERETIFEWIDLGAQFNALPAHNTSTSGHDGGQQ